MFDPVVSGTAIGRAEERLKAEFKDRSFRIEKHKPSETATMVEHFKSLIDPHSDKLVRDLSQQEIRWIQNERTLCRHDFRYWLERYSTITTFDGRLASCVPNVAQNIMLDVWAEHERRGIAIEELDLKARQLGVTTLGEMYVVHQTNFWPGTHAVIGSADEEASKEMFDKADLCRTNMPWWMQVKVTTYWAGERFEFGEHNSRIAVHWLNQKQGIARGRTVLIAHLTECVAPSTLVRLADGMVKPMAEVKPGDLVLTSKGRLEKVKHVFKTRRNNEMTSEIWLWGQFSPLSTTRDHRILTATGFRPAAEIRSGDRVRMAVRPISDGLKTFNYTKFPRGSSLNPKMRSQKIEPVTYQWGWFCGLYLAEGCLRRQWRQAKFGPITCGISFAVHEDEVDRFSHQLGTVVGIERICVQRRNSKTVILGVNDTGIARWVEENFGSKEGKHIPDWAWDTGPEFLKGIVAGYLEGDGHLVPGRNELSACSVRLQILIQIRDAVASLGCGWSGLSYKPPGEYYGRNCRSRWDLIFSGEAGRRLRALMGWPSFTAQEPLHWNYTEDQRFIEIEVFRNDDGWSEEFYDLEVDAPEHDFSTIHCCVHNCAYCSNPDQMIEASLLRAMHPNPRTFLILESTAAGMFNWWHKKWLGAVKGWASGASRLRPRFLPWFVGVDLYPTVTWLKAHPIPPNWKPASLTMRHAERARQAVEADPLLQKHLGRGWKMPPSQMWFWEVTREEYREAGILNRFYSEMPADPHEAFQQQQHSVFDAELLSAYRERVEPPKAVMGLIAKADLVPPRLQPTRQDVDPDRKPIPIKCPNGNSYQLTPLRWQGYQLTEPMGKVFIWEWPKDEFDYGFGADTGYGIAKDRSVIEMLRKASLDTCCRVVAEFASDQVSASDLAPFCQALGQLFTVQWKGTTRQPRAVVECNSNGESCQLILRKMGWQRWHQWVRYSRKKIDPSKATSIGAFTTGWSRAQILEWWVKAVRDCFIDIDSPWLISELATLGQGETNQKLQAELGGFDDRVMAAAWCFFSLHVLDRGSHAPQFGHRRLEEEVGPPEYDVWEPDIQYGVGLPDREMMTVMQRSQRLM